MRILLLLFIIESILEPVDNSASGHDPFLKFVKCYENREEDGDPTNLQYCMGHTCTRIKGTLQNTATHKNTSFDVRGCDALLTDPRTHHWHEIEHFEIFCDIDRAFAAFVYMYKGLHEKCDEKCQIYPQREGPLFLTDNECLDLQPSHFPQFQQFQVLKGKLTFCCCTRRLCNSGSKVEVPWLRLLVVAHFSLYCTYLLY